MSDAPKITRGIRLPVMTQEEIEARESERPEPMDPLAGFKAAADAYMRPVYERTRDAMDAALAVRRLTIPDDLLLTPEERERKEQERRLNELAESRRQNDELLRRRIQDDRARFIRDMAEANAAAMVQAQKSEPAQAEPAMRKRFKQDGLIHALEPFMREPGKLAGILSHANRDDLKTCRNEEGWDLGCVAAYLLRKGKLKDDITERRIQDLITDSP